MSTLSKAVLPQMVFCVILVKSSYGMNVSGLISPLFNPSKAWIGQTPAGGTPGRVKDSFSILGHSGAFQIPDFNNRGYAPKRKDLKNE